MVAWLSGCGQRTHQRAGQYPDRARYQADCPKGLGLGVDVSAPADCQPDLRGTLREEVEDAAGPRPLGGGKGASYIVGVAA